MAVKEIVCSVPHVQISVHPLTIGTKRAGVKLSLTRRVKDYSV